VAAYLAMVAAAVGVFFAVRSYGSTLVATSAPVQPSVGSAAGGGAAGDWLLRLLIAPTAIIVLSVGLDLGVVSAKLYAVMVLMALATTATTSPLLRWLKRRATPAQTEDLLADLD
jgi:hypothetical protein